MKVQVVPPPPPGFLTGDGGDRVCSVNVLRQNLHKAIALVQLVTSTSRAPPGNGSALASRQVSEDIPSVPWSLQDFWVSVFLRHASVQAVCLTSLDVQIISVLRFNVQILDSAKFLTVLVLVMDK